MSDTRIPSDTTDDRTHDLPDHRPRDRFWPYVELSEEPTDAELAALDPDLEDALFGRSDRPFAITLSFSVFPGENYQRAVVMASQASNHRTVGAGESVRHYARFRPDQAEDLRSLFEVVEATKDCEVLIDDRPVPYARELWLPLVWFLLLK